jgi:hypothetical protein
VLNPDAMFQLLFEDQRETLKLLRAYYKIRHSQVRKRIFEMVKSLGVAPPGATVSGTAGPEASLCGRASCRIDGQARDIAILPHRGVGRLCHGNDDSAPGAGH